MICFCDLKVRANILFPNKTLLLDREDFVFSVKGHPLERPLVLVIFSPSEQYEETPPPCGRCYKLHDDTETKPIFRRRTVPIIHRGNMADTREKGLQDYRKRLLEHKEIDGRLKECK